MIHNLLGLIWAFIILAHDTKYKILILRVDEIMLALFLAALESNEDKQVFIICKFLHTEVFASSFFNI